MFLGVELSVWVALPTGPEYFGGIGKHGGQNAMSDIRQLPFSPTKLKQPVDFK